VFVNEITAEQLKARLDQGDDFQLLDIRSEPEVQQGVLPKSRHLPMHLIPLKLQDLPKDKEWCCTAAAARDRSTPVPFSCSRGCAT
jgi:rhodanese-related sulfurtransferase